MNKSFIKISWSIYDKENSEKEISQEEADDLTDSLIKFIELQGYVIVGFIEDQKMTREEMVTEIVNDELKEKFIDPEV